MASCTAAAAVKRRLSKLDAGVVVGDTATIGTDITIFFMGTIANVMKYFPRD
jgi:hypothetical protein